MTGLNAKVISQSDLQEVRTITDLHPGFPASWIGEYQEVAVFVDSKDKKVMANGSDHQLNESQLSALTNAVVDATIEVVVTYLSRAGFMEAPEQKKIHFVYKVVPAQPARYPGGVEALKAYFQDQMIEQVAVTSAAEVPPTSIAFSVNTDGQIVNTRITMSSDNSELDDHLLEVVNNMSGWLPAATSSGEPILQTFEINIGDLIGC